MIDITILNKEVTREEELLILKEIKEHDLKNYNENEIIYLESGNLYYLGYNLKVISNNKKEMLLEKINY